MSRRSRSLGLLTALLFSSIGCWKAPLVEIKLTHTGRKLIRELTTWQEEKPGEPKEAWPSEELDRLRSAYAGEPVALDKFRRQFKGEFSGDLPVDINNKGRFVVYETPLGSQFAYLERIGGSDDLQAEVQRRTKAADRAADLLLGWLETEFGKELGWPRLRQFVDTQVRADIKNLTLLLLFDWSQTPTVPLGGEQKATDTTYAYLDGFDSVAARALQYGVDRGYFTLEEIPLIARASDNSTLAAGYIARIIVRELGLPANGPFPASVSRLFQDASMNASLDRYFRTTPEYEQARRLRAAEKSNNPFDSESQIVAALMFNDLLFGLQKAKFRPTVRLSLQFDGELFMTNGQALDASTKTIRWDPFVRTSPFLPRQVYAIWTKPNDAEQARLFGKTILTGQALGQYSQWYLGLTDAERKLWNEFLFANPSSSNFTDRLNKFQFPSTNTKIVTKSASPVEGARLIIEAWKGKPPER